MNPQAMFSVCVTCVDCDESVGVTYYWKYFYISVDGQVIPRSGLEDIARTGVYLH